MPEQAWGYWGACDGWVDAGTVGCGGWVGARTVGVDFGRWKVDGGAIRSWYDGWGGGVNF